MISNTITAVLFDFGGVLAEEGFQNGLLSMAKKQGLDADSIVEEGMQAVYDSGFVLGKGDASDFWTLMRQKTGLRGEDETLTRQILDGFVVRPTMIQLVIGLRDRGYLTGILSDQTHWLDELDMTYHFSKAFTRIYNSYYLGKGKRDVSLFRDVADDLDMTPESILFVDDNLDNVRRAESAGMKALQFVDEERFKVSLEKKLTGEIEETC